MYSTKRPPRASQNPLRSPCERLRIAHFFGALPLFAVLAVGSAGCGRFGYGLQPIGATPPDAAGQDVRSDAGLRGVLEAPQWFDSNAYGERTGGVDLDAGEDLGAGDAAALEQPADDAGTETTPEPVVGHLIHHYTFAGTGSVATDSVGQSNGQIVGATLDGTGDLVLLGGVSGPHVTLPAGLISGLQSVTVESWLTWAGGGGYQRIFDFGNNTGGAGQQGSGTRHFSLAVLEGRNEFRLVFDVDPSTGSNNWRAIYSAPAMSTNQAHQVVAVFDRGASEIRLYVDGARRASAAVPANEGLSNIDDVNDWLGMAQWAADPNLAGTLHDVRIYDTPLSDAEVGVRFQARYR